MSQSFNAITQAAEAIAHRNVQLRAFLLRLTDPDDLGYAVSEEVRRLVNDILHTTNARGQE